MSDSLQPHGLYRGQISSVQFSRSLMSDSLRPHEPQHTRPLCSSPTPGVYSNSCPSSRWCHPAISSSVVPFSSCTQSLPASGSYPMSQLFSWGGQSTGVSALASVLPMNPQDWCPLGWTGWISLQSKGLPRVFSNTTVQKHQFFDAQLSSQSNSHRDCTLQARILEWVAVPFSRESSQPRDRTQVSHMAGGFLTSWATREAQKMRIPEWIQIKVGTESLWASFVSRNSSSSHGWEDY